MNTTAVAAKAGLGAALASAATCLFTLRLSMLLGDVDSIVSGTASVDTQLRTVIELFVMAVGAIAAVWWALSYLLVLAALAAGTTSMVGRSARALVQRYGSRSARAMLASAAGMTLAFGAVPATAAPMLADSAPTSSTQQATDVTGTATPLTFLGGASDTESGDTTDEDTTQADTSEQATDNDSEINTPDSAEDSAGTTDQKPAPEQSTPEQHTPETDGETTGSGTNTSPAATDIPSFADSESIADKAGEPGAESDAEKATTSQPNGATTQAATHTPAAHTSQATSTDTTRHSTQNSSVSLLMLAEIPTASTTTATDTDTSTGQDAPSELRVAAGDSLWSITSAALPEGATNAEIAAAWPAVYEANRDVIGEDPNNITPGTVITIPTTLNSATSNATAK
ncbi:hypothetical protein [Jonesia quinghaiensis]|uniref:hypothetical protein n=1 Tax=Jonesia quinghaiensis TaxID=262806 RepID=UPI000404D617|nr:hypothetical protein [Jonesia quinghaiensis]